MKTAPTLQPGASDSALLDDIAGYLNFSSGVSDPKFLDRLNSLFRSIELRAPSEDSGAIFADWLMGALDRLQRDSVAFADVTQARLVVELLVGPLLPAYRAFHRDLLHHQTNAELWRPFFVGRCCEAILAQGPPWNDVETVVPQAIAQLDDYVGYRPSPVLSSGTKCEPYPHEFVRPVPLFIKDAGVDCGRYGAILSRTIEILRAADGEVLARAWFDMDRLEEIALDPRAYDFDHPVNRRPNYHFGQWDPLQISAAGYYSRFVLQQVTLDALLARCDEPELPPGVTREDRLEEAAAVLAGTMLMAAGTCGDGPSRHDSSVTLSTLLPQIASYRDEFYRQLLAKLEGPRGERLRDEAQRLRQPFGGALQHLNQELARRRAMQLQRVHLALLLARMGRNESALGQADSVRVPSARMLTAIYCRLTSGHDALDRDELGPVVGDLEKIEDLLLRAIECGALIDPWNIVGFAANFSLFPALENTVHDWRADELVELVEQILDLAARAWSEAAAVDQSPLEEKFSQILSRLASWWDRFAAASVEGVKRLVAKEIEVSANLVAGALNAWHKAGAAAGDVAFWRMFVEQFDTSKAFQLVVEALLDHGDVVASRALMMQWANQRNRTPLDDGDISFHPLAFRWLSAVEAQQDDRGENQWSQVALFFAYLEANAEEYWHAPKLWTHDGAHDYDDIPFGDPSSDGEEDDYEGLDDEDGIDDDEDYEYEYDEDASELLADDLDDEDDDEGDEGEGGLFRAAYDEMTFRGSTDDGREGDVVDGDEIEPLHTEWEFEADRLEQRLSFLNTVARLWKHVAISWGGGKDPSQQEVFELWLGQAGTNFRQLIELLEEVHKYRFHQPSGSHESLVEFDRIRTIKDALIQKIVATCVETASAARLLTATAARNGEAGVEAGGETDGPAGHAAVERFGEPLDAASVKLFRRLLSGDADGVRDCWDEFLVSLKPRQMLYIPHSRGGDPRQVVITRSVQRMLHDLLGWLPKLGLLRETCQLLDLAQQLETDNPVGQGAVTEFDALFENGYQAIVRAIVESTEAWKVKRSNRRATETDGMLVDVLQQLTERQLDRWLSHSRTLRLSIVEKLADEDDWRRFVAFVERYGADLFGQKFLSLGNLRGILHQGVERWLENLAADEEQVEQVKLLADLDSTAPREATVEMLSLAIEGVVENYREYRDYNTTTTQSDHGELLYTFIDFLRQRAAYDRVAWNLKPVVWAHEILVRHRREAAAEMWREAFAERTCEAADMHLQRLNSLGAKYGMQLPTIADRLNERFVRPLLIDRLRAMVEPSMNGEIERHGEADDHASGEESFAALEREIAELADEPHGSGLDVPDWLTALEDEVTAARSRLNHVSSSDRLSRRIGQVKLSWDDILEQLAE